LGHVVFLVVFQQRWHTDELPFWKLGVMVQHQLDAKQVKYQ
jgi:hypothetical protein